MRIFIAILLFVATICFALAVTQPLIHVERLWIFDEEPSLVEMIASLWQGGEWPLALLIGLFSIVTPAAKLLLLHIAVATDTKRVLPGWFRGLANWSMLDVVLVAIVIFAAKTSGLATAATKPGLWLFAASVVLTAVISALVRKLSQTQRRFPERTEN